MKTHLFSCLTALLGCAPLIADDTDLLGMVGENSDIVIHLSNTSKTRDNWDKSSIKKFVQQDPIQDKIDDLLGGLLEFDEIEDQESSDQLKAALTTLYESFDEEVLFTLATPTLDQNLIQKFKDADTSEDVEDRADLIFGQFGGLLLAEVGDEEEKAEDAIEDLLEVIQSLASQSSEEDEDDDSETTIIEKTISGIDVRVIHVKEGGASFDVITVGVVNKVLFATLGVHEAEDVIKAIQEGHDTPLSDSEYLTTGPSDLRMIMDLKDLMTTVRFFLSEGMEAVASKGREMNLDAGWKALGMDGFGQVAVNFDMSQPEINITVKIEVPTEGLVGSMMPNEKLKKLTTHAHKGVLSTTQYCYDWSKIFDEVVKTAEAFSPDLHESLVSSLASMEEDLGITLKEDILEHLDSHSLLVEYPDEDFYIQEMKMAFILAVKDQAKLEASLKTLISGLNQEIEEEDYLGKKINHVSLGPNEGVSYCFDGGQIIIGIRSAGAVKEAIKQINDPRPTLWNEDFLEDYQDYLQSGLSHLGLMNVDLSMSSMVELVTDLVGEGDEWSNLEMPFGYGLYGMNQKGSIQTYRVVLFPKN